MSCSRTQHGGGRSRTPDFSLHVKMVFITEFFEMRLKSKTDKQQSIKPSHSRRRTFSTQFGSNNCDQLALFKHSYNLCQQEPQHLRVLVSSSCHFVTSLFIFGQLLKLDKTQYIGSVKTSNYYSYNYFRHFR